MATPLRLVHLIASGGVDLGRVQLVCFDEADKLFEMGQFAEQVDDILAACTGVAVQRAMFSATISPGVEELATSILRDPVTVTIGRKLAGAAPIAQRLQFVGREDGKMVALPPRAPFHSTWSTFHIWQVGTAPSSYGRWRCGSSWQTASRRDQNPSTLP